MSSNKIIAQISLAVGYEQESCQMSFHFNYSTKPALLKLYLRLLAISSVTERSLCPIAFKGKSAPEVIFLSFLYYLR